MKEKSSPFLLSNELPARAFLTERGFDAAVADDFRLGFAPEPRTAFKDAMLARKIDEQALVDTGKLASVALFCIGTASAFGWLLVYYKIPQELLANVSTWGMGAIGVGFFIAFAFLVVVVVAVDYTIAATILPELFG